MAPSPTRAIPLACCAAILAASVEADTLHDQPMERLVDSISRYCTTSWRNAGLPADDWDDCTQDVLLEFLEKVPRERWSLAFEDRDGEERRELNRAIWRIVQRKRRAPHHLPLVDEDRDARLATPSEAAEPAPPGPRTQALRAELGRLGERRRAILERWSRGCEIQEIASALGMDTARVSDEKYKALRSLRRRLDVAV